MHKNDNTDYREPLTGGMEDSKTYRRFVASSSADQTDNRAVWNNEMNDAFAALKEQESTGVRDREEKVPLGIRILSPVLVLAALVFAALYGVFQHENRTMAILCLIAAFLCALGRSLVAAWKYRRNQKAWIDRVNHR